MQTKFGIDVKRDGNNAIIRRDLRVGVEQRDGTVKWFEGVKVGAVKSVEPCGDGVSVGYELINYPIKANSVAIVEVCEIGEHCRCKSFDVAYKADCWNWIGKVTL
jgi:hypothetical protein